MRDLNYQLKTLCRNNRDGSYATQAQRLFRSLKTEWVPSLGYATVNEAQRDISHYLMNQYNWQRPHQFNKGLPPAIAEEKLKIVSGIG